ncbi:hypothetical protein B0T25DRAFT_581274 [Lasiosphaeria hispida]|uniref:tRNA nucleotidyltransferase n=1 Tax=Lasiosphaeria hispida TaxID=260671 RepID=A0AAJ0HIW6_9PEZI|nr:hypothetical protein B0T25DRAFT_581274 [Lasiosphaeria hispida]
MLTRFFRFSFTRGFSSCPMKRKYGPISLDPQKKRAMTATLPTITLNPREEQLKGLLLDVARFIDENPPPATTTAAEDGNSDGVSTAKAIPEPVVLRWAGGWVRDKLLGIESHDIDTAINCMTGEAFVLHLRAFCDTPAHRERHSIGPDDVGSLHKIARNPEKSKHLETTTTRLFGLDVDFVNLRRETYTEESRNPQMEFGTAEEDALRRDATVNALFYNLHTSQVEDFTGGLEDMREKLIRTPLEPLQTFTDDPLRVLRLVRFASRLEFSIDPGAEGVMGDSRVLNALRLKISRERVGVELEKMLKGSNPVDALKLIDRLGLYHTIFTDPARAEMPAPDISNWSAAYLCLDSLARNNTPGSIYQLLVTSEEAKSNAWALAALAPWEQLPDEPVVEGRKPALPLAIQAAKKGFKAPNKLCDIVAAGHRHRSNILELKDIVHTEQPSMKERDRFGMAVREWDSRGGNWRLQVLYVILADVEARADNGSPEKPAGQKRGGAVPVEEVLAEWQRFLDHLIELDVMDAPSLKRLVDGHLLTKALGVKPGKWLGDALDVATAWQLRNPGVTDSAGAVEEVRKRKKELGIK